MAWMESIAVDGGCGGKVLEKGGASGHPSILVGRKHTRNSYPVKLGVADR